MEARESHHRRLARPWEHVGSASEARIFEANIRGFEFQSFFEKSNSQDNMLTGVSSSTIKTVIGTEFVREEWSIAFLFCPLVGVEFPLCVCDQAFFAGIVVLQHF